MFVVATANRIDGSAAGAAAQGSLRRDLLCRSPVADERAEIFASTCAAAAATRAQFDVARARAVAAGFSGAEIEQAVIAGLYQAFETRGALTQAHVLAALAETRPLSSTMHEEIAQLREWASTRTRAASVQDDA